MNIEREVIELVESAEILEKTLNDLRDRIKDTSRPVAASIDTTSIKSGIIGTTAGGILNGLKDLRKALDGMEKIVHDLKKTVNGTPIEFESEGSI